MSQSPAPHEGDRRDLYFAPVAAAAKPLGAQDVAHRLPHGSHVGIDLLAEVAGQEAQTLPRLHRGPRHDQSLDVARTQKPGAVGDREKGLSRAGGTEAEDKVVSGQRVQIERLIGGLSRHRPAPRRRAWRRAAETLLIDGHAHVGRRHLQTGGHPSGDRFDGVTGAAPRLGLARERDAAARRLQQDVKGVFDQGGMPAAGPGHRANGLLGQR